MIQFLNPVRNSGFLNGANKKILALLVLGVVFLVQAGFVLAVAGAPCANDAVDCPGGKCCCCPAGGCGTIDEPKGICGNTNCTNIVCPFSKHTSLSDLIDAVGDWVFNIAIVLCPLMIVIGAFLFMTSAGVPERAGLGKKIIFWAVIGLAFILFAKAVEGIIRHIVIGQ